MGSRVSSLLLKSALGLFLLLPGIPLLGMAKKPPVTIRFYAEANEHDTSHFAQPLQLVSAPRQIYIDKIPSIHEKMIRAIYPFQASNGTWGCSFQLDQIGRIDLETLSADSHGKVLVAVLATNAHARQVVDLVIDKVISDGVITIPYGLSELEVAVLKTEWPVIGEKKTKDKGKGKQTQKPNETIPGSLPPAPGD